MSAETLLLFTRFPVAGRAKTRLIPLLGQEKAAQLQREMTEHTLARIWPFIQRRAAKLEVRFEGGSKADMRGWLGDGLNFVSQGAGDLGERMSRASHEAFARGAQSVVIIGTDCPELNAAMIESAFDALRAHQVTFGPARDGGYYLVGMNAAMPQLFEAIRWSTSEVLESSIARARQIGIEPYLLPELPDVDEPADLDVWEKARSAWRTVSIVIPTLNEAGHLPLTLEHASMARPLEIIVADGGSQDDTVSIAQSCGAKVINCGPNRARQMNAGAAIASGEILLFLHADTLLPENWLEALLAALRPPDVLGGAFGFKIRDPFPGRWLVEKSTNLRSRLWRMPYGDQALFVRRWVFDELNGFPDSPIMEDYEFVRRLRRLGKLALLEIPVLTSARRWQRLGFLRTTLINKLIILGYRWGWSPAKLAQLYRGQSNQGQTRTHRDTVLNR